MEKLNEYGLTYVPEYYRPEKAKPVYVVAPKEVAKAALTELKQILGSK